MRQLTVPIAVSLTLAVAGCGGGSKADAVTSAWHNAANAMANADGATACRYFSAPVVHTLTSSSGLSCAAAVKELAQPLTAADRAGVKDVGVKVVSRSPTRAVVQYPLTPGLRKLGFTGRSRLVQSGGRWLIAPRSG